MMGKTGAESARRAVEMLFAFEQGPVATVRSLADKADIPVPSAHRYVAMLKDMGLIEEARYGQYRLTMRVASLAQAARHGTSLIDIVQPFMQLLHEETGETVLLVQPMAGLPVCTHRVEAQQRLRLSFEIGQHLPSLRGASAHLMVAAMPEQSRRSYVDEELVRGAQPPVLGVEQFLAEVRREAERGWTVSSDEIDEGIWAAAGMIRREGYFIETLSGPCPKFRIDDSKATTIIECVCRVAGQISVALGS